MKGPFNITDDNLKMVYSDNKILKIYGQNS